MTAEIPAWIIRAFAAIGALSVGGGAFVIALYWLGSKMNASKALNK